MFAVTALFRCEDIRFTHWNILQGCFIYGYVTFHNTDIVGINLTLSISVILALDFKVVSLWVCRSREDLMRSGVVWFRIKVSQVALKQNFNAPGKSESSFIRQECQNSYLKSWKFIIHLFQFVCELSLLRMRDLLSMVACMCISCALYGKCIRRPAL